MQQFLSGSYLAVCMRSTVLLLLVFVLPKAFFAQKVFLEPFGGYQIDINNSKTRLVNSGLQLAFVFKKQKYEILLQVQRSWPQSARYTDSAFTVNPNLPLYTAAPKTLSASSFSFAVGHRIKIAGRKTNNSFFVKAFTGITDQKTTVAYQYDKSNYIILNPDQTIEHAGIYVSGGFEYMRKFAHSRFFAELNFSSPPSGTIKYSASFNLVAPVSFNVGYSIQLSKR
ncbi:MAG: hypothetical protein ABJB86_16240 [Bacteroidota bacterium]